MTSRERFARMYAHGEADRVPITDSPWAGTLARWRREGMPADAAWEDFFDVDRVSVIGANNGPRYPWKVKEETPEWRIVTSDWGVTWREWKALDSTPEFLDYSIKDRASWADAKARMVPSRDRVDWAFLKREYPTWRARGDWIVASLWFGFDVTHSWAVGMERVLEAIVEDPDWLRDMFGRWLDVDLALFDMIRAEGYEFDCASWPDDMGFKHSQFFSVKTYRELLKPFHARAAAWAHAHGARVHLHSCGDVNPFIPELLEIGVDALNPLEVKAGMDPVALKARYGDRLVLHGGINAVLWDRRDAIEAEMRRVVPVMKQGGGYVFSSDHSIPNSVSLEDFRGIVALAKELGRY